jgi:hypothetical protein
MLFLLSPAKSLDYDTPLPAGLPHAERYGPEGAIYWVARRNPAGGG